MCKFLSIPDRLKFRKGKMILYGCKQLKKIYSRIQDKEFGMEIIADYLTM